jgi:beta-lactam-binding protein with PASTA domain
MPNVVDQTQDAATNLLTGKGLLVSFEQQTLSADDPRVGKVITQSVPFGTQVRKGTSVRLTIGKAAPTPTTTRPPQTSTTTTTR